MHGQSPGDHPNLEPTTSIAVNVESLKAVSPQDLLIENTMYLMVGRPAHRIDRCAQRRKDAYDFVAVLDIGCQLVRTHSAAHITWNALAVSSLGMRYPRMWSIFTSEVLYYILCGRMEVASKWPAVELIYLFDRYREGTTLSTT